MKRYFYTAAAFLFFSMAARAQVRIGAAGAADPSASLEVTGGPANNKGLLLPRLSTTERNAISLPATGLTIYNTTDNQLQVNTGTPAAPVWTLSTSNDAWKTTGNAGTDPAASFLGTTDGQPLVLRTANAERLRVTESGTVGIGTATPAGKFSIVGTFTPYAGMTIENTGVENATTMTVTPGFDMLTPVANITTFDLPGTGAFTFGDNVIPAIGMQLGLADRRWATVHADNANIAGIGRIGGSVPENTITSITGRDATGQIGNVALGAGLTFADGTLSATATGTGVNIYNSDGTLTGPRTVTQGANALTFNGSGGINFNSGNVGIGTSLPSGRLTVAGEFGAYAGITIENTGVTNATAMTVTPGFDMAAPALNIATFDLPGTGAFTFGDNVIPAIGMQLGLVDRRWAAVYAANADIAGIARIEGSAPVNTITSITGRDATGQIGNIALGAGLSFLDGTLSATATPSDRRLKKDIVNMKQGVEQLMKLRPVTYRMKDDAAGATRFGFIAQELEEVMPEVVNKPKTEKQFYSVNYAELVPVLTKAIQEQQSEIDKLKAENAALRSEVARNGELNTRIGKIEQLLQATGHSGKTVSSK
ncbi:MAG: tail fiber domain-containing protein [Dyadobacter sp.]|uniref:tail fiber domain-containing protein n=1 Tax=Dyadobacter sp. TaxID=1914288 RepID=UPI001AFF5FC3|nr:tail fiber domain-containing protein [Dyadobacter sp.]MBO9611833.1 tail fiber domain-containing protein [Dyadobacter sp.]